MNDYGKRYLIEQMNRHDGRRDRRRDREDRDYDDYERDYEHDYEMDSRRGRNDGYEDGRRDRDYEDGRRGVKGTGRGRRRDRGEPMRLSNFDMMRWKKMLRNADGTTGPHFEMQDIEQAVNKLGIRFDEYSEKEFCMVMNMLYSDYCEVNRSVVSPDKEAHYYAKLAQAWLEDDDGPEGREKLAIYFHCIADNE